MTTYIPQEDAVWNISVVVEAMMSYIKYKFLVYNANSQAPILLLLRSL